MSSIALVQLVQLHNLFNVRLLIDGNKINNFFHLKNLIKYKKCLIKVPAAQVTPKILKKSKKISVALNT
jgi:hypothetical protein